MGSETRPIPSSESLRAIGGSGFILEGYFAPRFQYDSNHNGWRRNFARLFAVPGRYRAIVEREGWVIVPGRSSPWTAAVDWALSPLLIAEHLARNSLSFQEADDLYEWAVAALHEDATGREADASITADLVVTDTTSEGPGRSLEYYKERAEQQGPQFEFRDIESLPSNTISLLRVDEAAGYLPTPKQKKKCHSRRKTTDTNEEDSYSSFGEESWGDDDPGPPWNPPKGDQMDVDNDGPSQL